jgi:hypothetical protein
VPYYFQYPDAFTPSYLSELQGQKFLACPHFTVNNLNRDFVKTKGFSIAFRRTQISEVERIFPYFKPYLVRSLQADCNAFDLNPLLLQTSSLSVNPISDRSLRSYCKTINPPLLVSVLYVQVPRDIQGGELVLANRNRSVAKIRPCANTLILFQGDLHPFS